MPQSWENHFRSEEMAAVSSYIQNIEKALVARNQGRNLNCWPLCSFGWKDADLDPEGCTGISEIVGWTENYDEVEVFKVAIGGHKTVCPPDNEDGMAVAQEIINNTFYLGFDGEWNDDSWVFSFKDEIEVTFKWSDQLSDQQNFDAAAEVIIEAARAGCLEFETAMKGLSAQMDELCEEYDKDEESEKN